MPNAVTAVVVTYQPDLTAVSALLRALAPQVDRVVVVDNASDEVLVRELTTVAGEVGAEIMRLSTNTGIGAAQNVGIGRAREHGAAAVLLSDQDSLPASDMVSELLAGLDRAREAGVRVAAVGPVTVDERAPQSTLLFEARRWGPRRAAVPAAKDALIPVVFLLASGALIPTQSFDEVGLMNESWFIDHIDLEWGLRAKQAGLVMYGVPSARLGHHLGDRTIRLPGRRHGVHIHSPRRNFYMARNTLLLVRSGLLPPAWRVGYVAWIIKYCVFYVFAVGPRWTRLRLLVRGLVDGILGRTGPGRLDD